MAQFKSPPENVWHQFFNQGLPQITGLVESNRKEKALKKREEKEDFLLISKSLIEAAGKSAANGNHESAIGTYETVLDYLENNDYGNLNEGFGAIVQIQKDSSEFLKNQKANDDRFINAMLKGNPVNIGGEEFIHPLDIIPHLSPEGKTQAYKFLGQGLDKFRHPGLESRISVINAILRGIENTAIRGRVGKESQELIRDLGIELNKLSTMGQYGAPSVDKIGGFDLPSGFLDPSIYSDEDQLNFFKNQIDRKISAIPEEEPEIDITDLAENIDQPVVVGPKVIPVDENKIRLEFGDGTMSRNINKKVYDLALKGGTGRAALGAYRNIANQVDGMSKEDIQVLFESLKPKGTTIIKPSSSLKTDEAFKKYYPSK